MNQKLANYQNWHPEDVKAAIRQEFGTVLKFEEHHKLPSTGVADVLRGRSHNEVTIAAINDILKKKIGSINLETTKGEAKKHRLNERAA